MTWLAIALIGFAVTDLAHSVLQRNRWPQVVGALAAVGVAALAGLVERAADREQLVVLGVVVALTLVWGTTVTRGFAAGGRAWAPLLVFGSTVAAALLYSPYGATADGLLGRWLDDTPWPGLAQGDPSRILLLAALVLVQLSTGNVIVRLVLAATGTVLPAQHGTAGDPETRLKGGRVLGPMERLVLLGLGLAGEITAAGIVIAAKGLLRFPELQLKSEQERIHQLTEYFLVGSFVSWLVPLGSLVLLA